MEEKIIKKIGGGLNPLPEDKRDFSHDAVFGSIKKEELPAIDFVVSEPLGIKDQGETDFCTAYATCASSEDQEGILLNPEFIFMMSKVLSKNLNAYGQDLRVIMKAHCKFGTIEQQYFPFPYDNSTPRNVIVDPKNWDLNNLSGLAYEHRKNSFFIVDGPYDIFDNFRSSMWMHKEELKSISTGAGWRDSWTKAPGGVIEDIDYSNEPESPHAFKIYGQKTINGVLYLIAQLSNGIDIGDQGLFYFPRGVVNREFKFGAFMFNDMPKEMAQYHAENGISIDDGLWTRARKIFRTIIHNYLHI